MSSTGVETVSNSCEIRLFGKTLIHLITNPKKVKAKRSKIKVFKPHTRTMVMCTNHWQLSCGKSPIHNVCFCLRGAIVNWSEHSRQHRNLRRSGTIHNVAHELLTFKSWESVANVVFSPVHITCITCGSVIKSIHATDAARIFVCDNLWRWN